MPDWLLPVWEKGGFPTLVLIAVALGVHSIFYRALWPFFLNEVWPQVRAQLEFNRQASVAQATQLKALYDVVLKVTSDYTTTDLAVKAAIERMEKAIEASLDKLETSIEGRFDKLITTLDRQVNAVNNLVEQVQRMVVSPPFIDDQRRKQTDFPGPEKRRQ